MIDRSTLASKRQKKRSDYAVYRTSEGGDKPKYYALDMFPYPSGAGLHVGHPKGYIATDVVSRQKKLAGYNVLHPMGFDSFGLPTENYAMKNKIHPSVATDQNISVFIDQLKKIGFNYDRDRMVSTADPTFYKRTQWMFIQLYEHRYDSELEKARPIAELKQLLRMREGENPVASDGAGERMKDDTMVKKYTKVLILDGFGGDGKSNRLPRLQRKLRSEGYDVQTPHLPANTKEDLDLVRQIDFVMQEYGDRIDEKTLIIGHGIGCVLALHVIQAVQKKIDTLFVAPCFDGMDRQYAIFTTPRFAEYEAALAHYYGQMNLDRDMLSSLVKQCTVMLSTDDPYIPYNDAVKYFKKYTPDCQLETFIDKGHFNIASGCLELPEILDYLRPTKYLIFDFDGVLADTFPDAGKIQVLLGNAQSEEEGREKSILYSSNKPDHTKDHTLTDDEMLAKKAFIKGWSDHQINLGFSLFDAFIDEIKKLQYARIAIVTSNSIDIVHHKKDAFAFTPTHILGIEDHHSKEEKIEQICRDRGCDVSEVYYFTDTKADVYELQDMIAPGKLIGCGRGFCGYDALCEMLPKHCVMRDFHEIHSILEGENERMREGKTNPPNSQSSNIPIRTLHKSHYQKDEAKIAKLLAEYSHSEDGSIDVTCAYIRGADGRIVLQHIVQSNIFVLPGGKVDKGETVEQAFMRECQEEVGITPTDYTLFGVCKIIHKGASWRLWYYDVTAYEGTITNLEPQKHDLQYACVEPSDNRWGLQVVLEQTIVSDADELNNSFRDIILCEKDFRDPRYKLEDWIDAPVVIESQDGEYITLWMDMATKQYVVRGQQEVTNDSKQHEVKTSPEIAAYHSRCRKQSLSDKENFHTLTDEEKIDRYIDTEKRLAFISHAPINWCPSCMTALANEDLDGNACERCGTTIERRKMRQWMIRITDYAQRLLDGLDLLPERQDNIKSMQRHWIGRSEGTTFTFQVANHSLSFDVYTTRIDTVYGVTFVSLAPEHALVEQITTDAQRDAVIAYVEESKNKTDIQRQEAKEKTGVWTGAYALNPFTNEQVPIRVADYVLMDYGTGAVMAVPAHDERDREFARKFELSMTPVVFPKAGPEQDMEVLGKLESDIINRVVCYLDKGILVNSGPFTGMASEEAIPAMQARLDEKGIGKKKINYRIQDRVFSRQRYRGEPIPMLYVPKRKVHELRFRDAKRRDALGVTKTIETRAGNPDEKERFFGDIAIGDIIAAKFVDTGAYKHFLVTKTYCWKQIRDLRDTGEETMQRIYSTGKAPSSYEQLVSDFEAISPNYAERIAQHGLYGFAIEPYDIATDISSNNYQIRPMASDELPLTLPDVAHYEPTGTEEGPLAKISEWIDQVLPDGTPARRESNTMPGWAGSSWYWIRYMDPRNANAVVSPEVEAYRGQVDLYVGGMEHACRHLIYARFRHKFLKDIGVVTTEEPFKRLKGVGLVLAEDGRKMSKRRGNVINPDDVIAEFGTDAFRTYEMFMGPFESEVARSTAGVKGVKRFLDKVVKMSEKVDTRSVAGQAGQGNSLTDKSQYKKTLSLLHKTIKKVGEDIDSFGFNTAVSQLMIYINHLDEIVDLPVDQGGFAGECPKELFEPYVLLIAPFAPHLAEELWEKFGHSEMIYQSGQWPAYDPALLIDEEVTMAVQVNGKVRGTITVAPTASQDEVMALIHADEKIASYLTGEIKKVIYIPGKICNVVV